MGLARLGGVSVAGGAEQGGGVEEFLRVHADVLLRHATIVSADPVLALDLVQAVLERLLTRSDAFAVVEDKLAYGKRAVTNEFFSTRRRLNRMLLTARPPDRADPQDLAASVTDTHALLHAVRGLSPRQRACIGLRYWLDFSDAQIAAELDLNESTVRSLIFRGLKRLRVDLSENGNAAVAIPGMEV